MGEIETGFLIICDQCGSTDINVSVTASFSVKFDVLGRVEIKCNKCGNSQVFKDNLIRELKKTIK